MIIIVPLLAQPPVAVAELLTLGGMSTSVKIKSLEGDTSLEFFDACRDSGGVIHCKLAVCDRDFSCVGSLAFHPGESSLVEFIRRVFDVPPVYHTDREFTGDTVKGARLCIGTYDDTADIALTVFVDSSRWHMRSFLVLSQDQFRQIADELSEFFDHENAA